ncbi:MAG: hypothetical protein DI622_21440 [Chryseobacterium sp.]|nr:MAG: hypothetical protein DI622_21440 [Chryseobacterium sp.]
MKFSWLYFFILHGLIIENILAYNKTFGMQNWKLKIIKRFKPWHLLLLLYGSIMFVGLAIKIF